MGMGMGWLGFPRALPNLFGGAVYAFMCHHSLPGIITPMRDKAKIPQVTRAAFVGVFIIYMLLFITCGVAFGEQGRGWGWERLRSGRGGGVGSGEREIGNSGK